MTVEGVLNEYARINARVTQHAQGPLGFVLSRQVIEFDRTHLGDENIAIIIEYAEETGEMQLSSADKSLGLLLDALRRPKTMKDVHGITESLGADASEIVGIVRFLVEERLIRKLFS